MAEKISVRRAYEEPGAEDGTRVLVDRLWPRGLTKEEAAIDEWDKEVAPSSELRMWYGHDPERHAEFSRRYRIELEDPKHQAAVAHLRELARSGPVTLITATKDVERSHVSTLVDRLQE